MTAEAASRRYAAAAIVLHWAIAAAILFLIPLGWWMGDAVRDPAQAATAISAYQLHKSIGLTVLALSLARFGLRLANPPPPLPESMKPWERALAQATHWGFYALMVGLPLSGWIYVSTQWSAADARPLQVPTLWFGVFEVPHLFGLAQASQAVRAGVAGVAEFAHSKLAWVALGLAALHAAAALKHHLVDRDDTLTRMVPGLRAHGDVAAPRPFEPVRAAILALGGVGLAASAVAIASVLTAPARSAPVAPVEQAAAPTVAPIAAAPAASATPSAAPGAAAPQWRVDAAQSAITFSGTHAGAPFEGRFSAWSADIRFDPADLSTARVVVTIQTASAADGNPLHDSTLPQGEWFNVARYPTAEFRAEDFRRIGGDRFEARGALRIKDRTIPLTLPFTLTIAGDRATMRGAAQINRAEADLGQASDAAGDWVSPTIDVGVAVTAARAP
ncbi:MAG: cytochrome b/b6 domain-containing protein [Hyphomonadaceae bacterium]|nr:cytochrome b/b6 domain-containing protein [Hyphomonadaceae bacterium]